MESQQKRKHIMVERLYDAALNGDVNCLIDLLQEDPLILDRCIIEKSDRFGQSPLHVVANLGHYDFAKEILDRKPELLEELNKSERSSSALHIAVINQHLLIVKELVAKNSHICLAKDQDGRNPVHVAAIRGKIPELKVLVSANPQAARERTNGGDTVLHLCVKHKQAAALEYLVDDANDDFELLNAKDSDGNTVLHLAILANQLQMVQLLLRKPNMEQNAMNNNGFTAMDTFNQNKRDQSYNQEIWKSLKRAKAYRSKDVKTAKNVDLATSWLERQRNALMVVASLIATMAFQVAVNPPGGAWQDEKLSFDQSDASRDITDLHVGGTSIMSTLNSTQYDKLLISNTIGFLSSLSVILLLISGLPCKRFFVFLLMIVMWVAISATAFTYLFSVGFLTLTPKLDPNGSGDIIMKDWSNTASNVVMYTIFVWLVLNLILLCWHGIRVMFMLIKRWIWKPTKELVKSIIKWCVSGCIKAPQTTNHADV